MEMDLKPKKAQPMLEGDGGVYSIWSSSQVPLLTKNNVAAGCVKLQPRVLALPHYSDSDKIGLVIQGICRSNTLYMNVSFSYNFFKHIYIPYTSSSSP